MDDLKDLRGAVVREVHRDDAVIITGAEYLSLKHRVRFGHQDPSTDIENVNAAYRVQFDRANRAEAELKQLREACVVEFDDWLDCKLCEAFTAPEVFKHKPGCPLDA